MKIKQQDEIKMHTVFYALSNLTSGETVLTFSRGTKSLKSCFFSLCFAEALILDSMKLYKYRLANHCT